MTLKGITWLTNSDGVGAKYTLEKTREYHFMKVGSNESLNIWPRRKTGLVNQNYTHDDARKKILAFIQDADYLVAYEPPSNDRNRLKSLFGADVYEANIEPKAIDFKRTVIDTVIKTDKLKEDHFIYLPGKTLPEVYNSLLHVGDVSHPEPEGFLPISDEWKTDIDMKCPVDVHQLHNLFIYFQSIQ
jgi:hypothetical protein